MITHRHDWLGQQDWLTRTTGFHFCFIPGTSCCFCLQVKKDLYVVQRCAILYVLFIGPDNSCSQHVLFKVTLIPKDLQRQNWRKCQKPNRGFSPGLWRWGRLKKTRAWCERWRNVHFFFYTSALPPVTGEVDTLCGKEVWSRHEDHSHFGWHRSQSVCDQLCNTCWFCTTAPFLFISCRWVCEHHFYCPLTRAQKWALESVFMNKIPVLNTCFPNTTVFCFFVQLDSVVDFRQTHLVSRSLRSFTALDSRLSWGPCIASMDLRRSLWSICAVVALVLILSE